MSGERLLLASEVADLLRVSRSTVYEWARLGLLPSVVLRQGRGRAVRRWRPEDIKALIEANLDQGVAK